MADYQEDKDELQERDYVGTLHTVVGICCLHYPILAACSELENTVVYSNC